MGSGGGRSSVGITTKRSRRSSQPGSGAGGGGSSGGDGGSDCDLSFETDLASVQPNVLPIVGLGDELPVILIKQGTFDVAVCRTDAGEVVGSLANVEDLATLISCIKQGVRYAGTVMGIGKTYCTVFVERRS